MQLAQSEVDSYLIFEDDVQFLDSMSQWEGHFNRIQDADPEVRLINHPISTSVDSSDSNKPWF
jgi:hypothetical protein